MVNFKVGDVCNASVTYKNDHGVFVDAGDFSICLALKDNLPAGFYDSAKTGDRVKIEVLNVDEHGRCKVAVIEVIA